MSTISKYRFGKPFPTDAVVKEVKETSGDIKQLTYENGTFTVNMSEGAQVFGLGENVRGINKRGWIYITNCTDDDMHTEIKTSLYGAHNFLVCNEEKPFGIFIDYPGSVRYDVGYTKNDVMTITPEKMDVDVYIIEGKNLIEIVTAFRELIGESYIAPKWALGYQQSRWGYENEGDISSVIDNCKKHDIPLDTVYLDIDYMQNLKDFTVDPDKFPDFSNYVAKCKEAGIRLIPIIDAGVKMEEGYDIYEEGVKNGYFIQNEDGTPFEAAVWPGRVHFPDFLNPEAREWFGMKYKSLIDQGIEGFWNDMNEPSIFYTPSAMKAAMDAVIEHKDKEIDLGLFFGIKDHFSHLLNNHEYFKQMYHKTIDGVKPHSEIHNLYGYNMTRAASEAFDKIKEERMLLFSRASSIGMHRYSGIWTGDNRSWWSHLLLNIKMMPSLNMCGFVYSGADVGGFSDNTTEDLLTRWLQFGIFSPLLRNHSAKYTRNQEPYNLGDINTLRTIIRLRYRLSGQLYSDYVKACKNNTMYFKALAFEYTDAISAEIEDQLLVGDSLMIAPVYEQNKTGRMVYLPEDMLCVRFLDEDSYELMELEQGHHYIEMPMNEVVVFVRPNQGLILNDYASTIEKIDTSNVEIIAYGSDTFSFSHYEDDGLTKEIDITKGESKFTFTSTKEEMDVETSKSKQSNIKQMEVILVNRKEKVMLNSEITVDMKIKNI